jgi:uncharacterized membrane protein
MSYHALIIFHLTTVLPCVLLGGFLLASNKGSTLHRILGAIYMILMMITAISALFIPALVGPQVFGHFGVLHLLSIIVLWTVPNAWLDAKNGRIKKHQRRMVILYVSAIIIAGGFTFFPGRYLHGLFFG